MSIQKILEEKLDIKVSYFPDGTVKDGKITGIPEAVREIEGEMQKIQGLSDTRLRLLTNINNQNRALEELIKEKDTQRQSEVCENCENLRYTATTIDAFCLLNKSKWLFNPKKQSCLDFKRKDTK